MYYLILLILTFISAKAANNDSKTLQLKYIDSVPVIDGSIEDVWFLADSALISFQLMPYYGKEPSRKTSVKIFTDKKYIYALFICEDKSGKISSPAGVVDNAEGDFVSLMIDTFNDKKTAYKFGVTAAGVISDARLIDDGRNRDYNWNGIWDAASRITEHGFVVEMRIPFSTLQYADECSSWGLDFDRWIPHNSEDLYWCEYDEKDGQRISKFGKLVFNDFYPKPDGGSLEIFPVSVTKAVYSNSDKSYTLKQTGGIDLLYNPSQALNLQLTANPDFAQIEADPFSFNISKYESYYSEKRPFFTQGNEIFMPSGKESNSGFYSPLEFFYSRRIGRKLPDGQEVPLIFGAKASGRNNGLEFGGFTAYTGDVKYSDDDSLLHEKSALFTALRLKQQILSNSTIGLLFVGKTDNETVNGLLNLDGAFRGSSWQLAYQIAGSIEDRFKDFAFSSGFKYNGESFLTGIRTRFIGRHFDVSSVGFVPWKGTAEYVSYSGPVWKYNTGKIRSLFLYTGPTLFYDYEDRFTDYGLLIGINMQMRSNWGFELSSSYARTKDDGVLYHSYDMSLSSWFNTHPSYSASLWGSFSHTYNYSDEYLGYFGNFGGSISYKISSVLKTGSNFGGWYEMDDNAALRKATYNFRPFVNVTPINNLTFRLFSDITVDTETERLNSIFVGFLFSYNFAPKSTIYLALNENLERNEYTEERINRTVTRLQTVQRAAVVKINYLYFL